MTDLVQHTPQPTQAVDFHRPDLHEWASNLAAAHQIGTALCGTSFAPVHFRGKPDEAAAAILYGSEVGFTPTQALQNLYVIGGKPALYARPMVAIVQAAGHEVWTEQKTDDSVTVCGRRRGTEHVITETWTIDRARKAGYTNNKKYQTDPQAMLYARAASDVCRQIAADALAGMAYSVEELELAGEVRDTGRPVVAAPPMQQPGQVTAAAFRQPAPASAPATHGERPSDTVADEITGEVLEDEAAGDEPEQPRITPKQQRHLFQLFKSKGVPEAEQLAGIAHIIGRPIESRTAMTEDEWHRVIDRLEQLPDGGAAAEPDGDAA
ncbi:hypothetical protein [Terrabacter sp. NPDC000476]|uniref:hypothetical protein n=1 Tax=Terrabacter sp. NPDC000476 TaxID=3154258 RepID=UPI00332A1F71